MRIAIIGTGISGLGAAYLLAPHHDIAVYEKETRTGGHSRTIDLDIGGRQIPVDTGFIVYNERNYPHLTAMFRHLGVKTQKSDMSFGASIRGGYLEYGSKGMFSQKRNFVRPAFWRMIFDILRFNRAAESMLDHPEDLTLAECLDRLGMGDWFRRYYLQAMGAAIWSCSVETILEFPAQSFIRFFKNHGLLTVNDHPQWYTVTGGSREYVRKLSAGFADKIKTGGGAARVRRIPEGLEVTDAQGNTETFDRVVFACHADEALTLLVDADSLESEILGAFHYNDNRVVVHGDTSFMPRRRGAWASWVYLSEGAEDKAPVVSLSYWMNNLQNLPTEKPVIITLNPGRVPAAGSVFNEHVFSHPVFTLGAIRAQRRMGELQGRRGVGFCGAYMRYGFHEDGLLSAVDLCRGVFGVNPPWP
ncbi:MAG: NAD(P)-binding protein [Alphaproteobacteria bacterium]|nr:NAD(P)-binding protein [Alphaproteobacteria bacterium]